MSLVDEEGDSEPIGDEGSSEPLPKLESTLRGIPCTSETVRWALLAASAIVVASVGFAFLLRQAHSAWDIMVSKTQMLRNNMEKSAFYETVGMR